MEIEAWFLAIPKLFEKIHPSLTLESILDKAGIDLLKINPEEEFHPAYCLNEIYAIGGLKYNKSESDVCKILSLIEISDYQCILNKCSSFRLFKRHIDFTLAR